MSRHEGVSCDSCLRNNFKGRRYKCLVCYDYDLCSNCYESGAASARHSSSHAMQCMLPRAEYELYYAGEQTSLTSEQPLSLTCPYCGRMGLTETSLYDHVCSEHTDNPVEVVCPMCASQPGGEPNNVVLDFVAHIQREHRTSSLEMADPSSASLTEQPHTNTVGSRQPQSRRLPQRGGTSSGGASNGIGRGSRRPQMQFQSMPLSPRESAMESITELLSQLSGARRTAAHNSTAQQTIQQLQMQLERQHSQSVARQHLDKLPSRQRAAGSTLSQAPTLQPDNPLHTQANPQTDAASQYLLARYLNEGGSRGDQQGDERPDRAQFVENLLVDALLSNSALLAVRSSQGSGRGREEYSIPSISEAPEGHESAPSDNTTPTPAPPSDNTCKAPKAAPPPLAND